MGIVVHKSFLVYLSMSHLSSQTGITLQKGVCVFLILIGTAILPSMYQMFLHSIADRLEYYQIFGYFPVNF